MRVLIADQDDTTCSTLHKHLKAWGYEVVIAETGTRAWEVLLDAEPPAIAVLAWFMPEIDGIEICKRMHGDGISERTYTILTVPNTDDPDFINSVRALECGADDFLVKPVRPGELKSRVSVGARLMRAEEGLRRCSGEVERMARTDSLTGAFNRCYFLEMAQLEFNRAKRYQNKLSVLLMNVGHTNTIPDHVKATVMEMALRRVSETCLGALRKSDLIARIHDDALSILLPETDEVGVLDLAERLRRAVQRISLSLEDNPERRRVGINVSFGATSMKPSDKSADVVISRADQARLRALSNGQNQTILI